MVIDGWRDKEVEVCIAREVGASSDFVFFKIFCIFFFSFVVSLRLC